MATRLRSAVVLTTVATAVVIPASPAHATSYSVSSQATCTALPVATTWTEASKTCELGADWTIGAADTVTVALGTRLSVPTGRTLTNQGSFTNNGQLFVSGGTFANAGSFDNVFYVDVRNGGGLSGTVTNAVGGVITTRNQFYLNETSQLTNAGSLTITNSPSSILESASGAAITNSGTITNGSRLLVAGSLANSGSVTNNSVMTFDCGTLTGNAVLGTAPSIIHCLRSGTWEVASNWTWGVVPSAADTVKVIGDGSATADLVRTGTTTLLRKLTIPAGHRLDNSGTLTIGDGQSFPGTAQLIVEGEFYNTAQTDVLDTLTVKGLVQNNGTVNPDAGTGVLSVWSGGHFVNPAGHAARGGLDVRAGGVFDNFGSLRLNRSQSYNAGQLNNKVGATIDLGNDFTNNAGGVLRNEGTFVLDHRLSLPPDFLNEQNGIVYDAPGSSVQVVDSTVTWTNQGNVEHRGSWANAGTLTNSGSFCGNGSITGNAMTGSAQVTSCNAVVSLSPITTVREGQASTVSATFQDPGLPDTYTASIDWGDGTTTTPTVGATGTSRSFTSSHTFASGGDHVVVATVCATGGTCSTPQGTASVTPELPPVATDDSATTEEDTAKQIATSTLLANDTDGNGDTLGVTGVSDPSHGTVGLANGTVTFTPSANYNGTAGFDYSVTDGHTTDTGHVTVTVTAVNDAPVAGNDEVTTDEDVSVLDDVLVNDNDPDGDPLTLSIQTAPSHGSASVQLGQLRYDPDPNWSGSDVVTYEISDGKGGSDTATLSITVNAVNDAPTAVDDAVTTPSGVAVATPAGYLVANDTDVELGPLTVISVGSATHGTVSLADGVVTFTPEAGFAGAASYTYTVSDGAAQDVATVLVTVEGAPDLAVTTAGAVSRTVGTSVTTTFTTTSHGTASAAGVSLSVDLGGTFRLRATPSGCTWSTPTLSCALGDLAPGTAKVVTVTGAYVSPGSWEQTATATTQDEPALGDNTAARVVSVTGKACTKVGSFGNDTLVGTSGADVLCGLAGNDVLDGRAGADVLYGNEGVDTISFAGLAAAVKVDLALHTASGQGNDTFADVENANGSPRADVLRGDSRANVLRGLDGNDSLYGLAGNDELYGGAGVDVLRGGTGTDKLDGGPGGDTCAQGSSGGVPC